MYAQKKSIDNTHIVRERDRRRFRELLAVLSLGVPVGLFLLLFTWQNLEVIRLGREATRLQQKRKEIEDSNKVLRLELDRLTALDSVEQKATGLGFTRSDPRAIVMVVPSSGETKVSIPAAPAPQPVIAHPSAAAPQAPLATSSKPEVRAEPVSVASGARP